MQVRSFFLLVIFSSFQDLPFFLILPLAFSFPILLFLPMDSLQQKLLSQKLVFNLVIQLWDRLYHHLTSSLQLFLQLLIPKRLSFPLGVCVFSQHLPFSFSLTLPFQLLSKLASFFPFLLSLKLLLASVYQFLPFFSLGQLSSSLILPSFSIQILFSSPLTVSAFRHLPSQHPSHPFHLSQSCLQLFSTHQSQLLLHYPDPVSWLHQFYLRFCLKFQLRFLILIY